MPFFFEAATFIANALARYLTLELSEREENVQGKAAHRTGGVELLGDGDEAHPVAIERLDDLGKICQRPGQPVYFIDHHRIDPARADIGEQHP
jgi:hypothetical protein